MRILKFTDELSYQNILYIIDSASINVNTPINRLSLSPKDSRQGFSWEPQSVGFFLVPGKYYMDIEIHQDSEIHLNNTTVRAIQVPFVVGGHGVTIEGAWWRTESMRFYIPPGEYALIFETGYAPGTKPQLAEAARNLASQEILDTPEVREIMRKQHEAAKLSAPAGEWYQVSLGPPDYDERLQRWIDENEARLINLTGGHLYENDGLSMWCRFWFKPQTNAEPKILKQDSLLQPSYPLKLSNNNLQDFEETIPDYQITNIENTLEPAKIDFRIIASLYISTSYNSFSVYDPTIIEEFGNDMTNTTLQQGFAWRDNNVDFYAIRNDESNADEYDECGFDMEVIVAENFQLSTEAIRAIQVPFKVIGSEGIGICEFECDAMVHIPPNEYALIFEQGWRYHPCTSGDISWLYKRWGRLWFIPDAHAEPKVLLQDKELNPREPLFMESKPLNDPSTKN
ncbi:MAG: competence protein ComJ [Methylococcales bacterium]